MKCFFRIVFILLGVLYSLGGFAQDGTLENEVIHLDVEKSESIDALGVHSETGGNSEDLKSGSINDNIDSEFSIFDNIIDKDKHNEHPFKIEEESLFGRIYNRKIEKTSIPSYLLQDELTFKYKSGVIDKVQIYGAYQGSIAERFEGSDYDTAYDIGFINVGAVGDFRNRDNKFKVQFRLKPLSGESYMNSLFSDMYIMNTSIPNHKIIVGNSRDQIGFEGATSGYTLPFATRSQIARNFGNVRVLGVRVVGNYSLADYQLSLNSSDRYFHEFFPGAEFTGWVNLKPLGKTDGRYGNLVLGGGLNAGRRHGNYTVGGAYVGYSYKKFGANAEYAIADGYNGRIYSPNKATGFYTTLSYRLTKKLHVLARFDQFDPNRDIRGDLRREYSAGINYFIKGQAFRIILNYVFCDNQSTQDSHRIILGTQLLL